MNARRSQVKEPDSSTFHWIFKFGPKHQVDTGDQSKFSPGGPLSSDSGDNLGNDHSNDPKTSSGDEMEIDSNASDLETDEPIAPDDLRSVATRSFLSWLSMDVQSDQHPRIFWISGKPGSGKSKFLKSIIEDTRTRDLIGQSALILSCFVWRTGSELMQRSIQGLACSLLYQLLLEDEVLCDRLLTDPRTQREKDYGDWSLKDLKDVLKASLQITGKPVCIFLDGLGEIDPSEDRMDLLNWVEELSRIHQVKICVSSRPEVEFRSRLQGFPSFPLHYLTSQDILNYVFNAFYPDFISRDQFSDLCQLVRAACSKSDGVFLWVVLVVKTVVTGIIKHDTPSELQERLEALPSEIPELCETMWKRLDPT